MTKVFGIDISVWQRGIKLATAKSEGASFVIIRGMYGNAKDVEFENFYREAKSVSMGVGVYQWGRAANIAQAREEAQLLIEHCLKGKVFDYPIYYDVEDKILLDKGVIETSNIVKAWCETIESAGYFAGVYMNQTCFQYEVLGSELAELYSQWRAYWTTEDRKPICQMWQFGGETNLVRSNRVAGYVCDQDFAYEDFPTIIKNASLNGYNNIFPSPKKNTDEIVREVINGLWGNGEARKNLLTNAGYDYNKIQAEVNRLLNNNLTTAKYYVIQPGDTLSQIAKNNNTTVNQLVNWNNIKNPNLIYAGQKIRIK